MNDDSIILDRTVADQVSMWKSKRGLTDDELVLGHACSGNTCTYTQIGDVFICEKTGRVHVCDDACREVVLDQSSGTLVCTISGHCFDRCLSPDEETDNEAVCILQYPNLYQTHTHNSPPLRNFNLTVNFADFRISSKLVLQMKQSPSWGRDDLVSAFSFLTLFLALFFCDESLY